MMTQHMGPLRLSLLQRLCDYKNAMKARPTNDLHHPPAKDCAKTHSCRSFALNHNQRGAYG